MAEGTPQAFSTFSIRVSLALFALSALVMAAMVSASQINAQTPEGTVRIMPAISSVAAEQGPFTVFIVLEDLEHYGALLYDDNRDTTPDREVESVGLAAFEFIMEYEPTVLALADVERGPDLERSGRTFQCLPPREEPGSFRFGCLSLGPEPPGPQGTLTLASVTLRPLGPGASPLLLEVNLAGPLGADEVPVAVGGGVVHVTGSPVVTATRAPATPSPPGGGGLDTPASAGTAEAPSTAQNGEAVEMPTSPPAPAVERTLEAPTVEAAGDGADAKDVTVRGDIEAEKGGPAAAEGGSSGNRAPWLVVVLGSLAAVGALGLAAALWQRRGHRLGG